MNDEQLVKRLCMRSPKFRKAVMRDGGTVREAIKLAREEIRPQWIELSNDDPLKADIAESVRQNVVSKLKARNSTSILGTILLGVVVNLIVRAILGIIT